MVSSRSVDRLSWSCLIWHPTILGGFITLLLQTELPYVSDSKESACDEEDPGSISGLRTFPGEENGYLLQYSCLKENSMDKGAWQAIVHVAGHN